MALIRKTSVLALVALAFMTGLPGCDNNKSTSPTVVATATPSPSPTPSPSTTPTPSPSLQSCNLAGQPECSLPGGGGCCRFESDRLGEFVEQAIRDVQGRRPDLFNADEILREADEDLVVSLVARTLEQRFGLCARAGSPVEDEVAVKNSNNFSEQFDIILSNHRVNIHGYTVTCRPARF